MSEASAPVTITVTNRSSGRQQLVLEPAGEVYVLEPGEARTVRYVGDNTPRLAFDLRDGEAKIWEEGTGFLELAD